MNEKLKDLYYIPERVLPQNAYLLDLAEQCAHLEEVVCGLAERLPARDREKVVCYIQLRDELEFQSVKAALRFSKFVK